MGEPLSALPLACPRRRPVPRHVRRMKRSGWTIQREQIDIEIDVVGEIGMTLASCAERDRLGEDEPPED